MTTTDVEDDLGPMLNLLEQEELLSRELQQCAAETVRLVAALGSQRTAYHRERKQAVQRMVAEVYSAPRVTKAAKLLPSLRLLPGFALDFSGEDDEGQSWDFTRAEMREKARALVLKTKPLLLIGSPPCTQFCSWQTLNAARLGWTAEDVQIRRAEGELHVRFCCELYGFQAAAGRYYLHEHPANATSWQLKEVQELLRTTNAAQVVGDQCQYGQETAEGCPIKKPTRWLSNSPKILEALEKRCSGRTGECSRAGGGNHVPTSGKIAREAAVYPFKLCRAILKGCARQLQADGRLQLGHHGVQGLWDNDEDNTTTTHYDAGRCGAHTAPEPLARLGAVSRSLAALGALGNLLGTVPSSHETAQTIRHDQSEILAMTDARTFKDSVTGQPLPEALVRAARQLELDYFKKKHVWDKVPRSEAWARTGKPPITVRWIDTNKGGDDTPNVRCRLVAREIRKAGEDPIFAPTPPLESLRTIISLAATDFHGAAKKNRDPNSPDRIQVSFIDISCAYLCAATDPDEPTYVELPAEDPDHKVLVGRLRKHMYGTRKAADGWHCEYAGCLVNDLGFNVGDASACVFYHTERQLRCSVHGDDLTTVGSKTNLDWFKAQLEGV